MENNLSLLEEFDIERKLQTPHLLFSRKLLNAGKSTALIVLRKKEDEILLINALGFKDPAVFAGLNSDNISYIARCAPFEYKQNLMEIFSSQDDINEAWKIAVEMDEDNGVNIIENQERLKLVIQYIRDNIVAFQI